jgi:aerobic-type carbon monoxide dehydrogenase small subunit (CoxS/CutS family)
MLDARDQLDISLMVNGIKYERKVPARQTLADFLRGALGLTGTHVGCEHGVCGACTVLIDGAMARSCLTLAAQADGCAVTTVEGLAESGTLHPVQVAFKSCHALQCGFCTPGFLISSVALLNENADPSEDEVRDWLSGNICRCTGYQFIIDAVLKTAGELRRRAQAQAAE